MADKTPDQLAFDAVFATGRQAKETGEPRATFVLSEEGTAVLFAAPDWRSLRVFVADWIGDPPPPDQREANFVPKNGLGYAIALEAAFRLYGYPILGTFRRGPFLGLVRDWQDQAGLVIDVMRAAFEASDAELPEELKEVSHV